MEHATGDGCRQFACSSPSPIGAESSLTGAPRRVNVSMKLQAPWGCPTDSSSLARVPLELLKISSWSRKDMDCHQPLPHSQGQSRQGTSGHRPARLQWSNSVSSSVPPDSQRASPTPQTVNLKLHCFTRALQHLNTHVSQELSVILWRSEVTLFGLNRGDKGLNLHCGCELQS